MEKHFKKQTAALEGKNNPWDSDRLRGSHATFLLNHPLVPALSVVADLQSSTAVFLSDDLAPRLRPLCLWKWYSAGMPAACQDVTVFPHRSHLCVHTSTFVWRRRETRCHDWLTGFIYNYAVFYFRLVDSGEMRVSTPSPHPPQHLLWRESAISAQAVTEMSTAWKHASWHF